MTTSTISVSNYNTLSTTPFAATTKITPFNPSVNPIIIADSAASTNYTYKATISYNAANGVLSETTPGKLSAGTTSKGIITYTITATTPALLTTYVQDLQFIPTLNQLTDGGTRFNLTLSSSKTFLNLPETATATSPLVIDSKGDVFFQDATANTIDEYTAAATAQSFTASTSTASGIAVDSNGSFYIGNTSNGNVTEYSKAGVLLQTITTGLADLGGIAVDSKGNLDVTDDTNGNILQFSTATGKLNWGWTNAVTTPVTSVTTVNNVATDSNGNVFVYGTKQVSEYSQAGKFLNTFSSSVSSANITKITGIATDSSGNLFVSDKVIGVVEFKAGSTTGTLLANSGSLGATSVATDTSGNIYIAYSSGTADSVYKYTSAGVQGTSPIFSATTATGISSLALDSKGDLFINLAGTVTEYTATAIPVSSTSVTSSAINVLLPSITSASYDASNGQLTITGTNLTTVTADYIAADLTITGQGKTSYKLIADATTVVNTTTPPTSTQVIINLSTANQQAIDGLLNNAATKALDNTVYNLSASAAWDTSSAPAVKSAAITVTHAPAAPSINDATASYNSVTGLLTITGGTNLVEQGAFNALSSKNFSLSSGSKSLTLSGNDTVSAIGANNAFSITLSTTEQKSLANLLGTSNSLGLAVKAGWDAGLGIATTTPLNVTVVGAGQINLAGATSTNFVSTANSNKTILPFAHTTLTDTSASTNSAVITVSSGTLSDTTGSLLSKGSIAASGVISYTIAATSTAALQTELQSLKYIPPTTIPTEPVTVGLTIKDAAVFYPLLPTATITAQNNYSQLLGGDSAGNIYVETVTATTPVGAKTLVPVVIEQFSNTGQLTGTLTLNVNSNTIDGFSADSKGDIFISFSTGTVQEYNVVATSSAKYFPTPAIVSFSGLNTPVQTAVDSSGNLFVVNLSAASTPVPSIKEFNAAGTVSTTVFSDTFTAINSIAVDSAGTLYVAKAGAVDQFKAGTGTITPTFFSGSGTGTLVNPQHIVTDSSGNVYVSDANANGAFVDKFSSSGVLLNTISSTFTSITGISTDSKGDLYIDGVNSNSNITTVLEYSSAGSLLRSLTSNSATSTSQFSLALDSSGNVYLDNGGNTISKYLVSTPTPHTVTDNSSIDFVNAGSSPTTNYTVSPSALSSPNVILAPNQSDTITIADAGSFVSTAITSSQVTASGNVTTTLAGWVNGVLSSAGGNLASHAVAWFQFGGDTYLLEQAGATGSAYTASDTLVQLVGVTTSEATAGFTGHTITLAHPVA